MTEILGAVASVRTFLLAITLFGLMPGVVLRLVVLLYPKGDARRAEALAELRVVPRWERPFWVFEQLEIAFAASLATQGLRWRQRRAYYSGMCEASDEVIEVVREHLIDGRYLAHPDGAYFDVRTLSRVRRLTWWTRRRRRIVRLRVRMLWMSYRKGGRPPGGDLPY